MRETTRPVSSIRPIDAIHSGKISLQKALPTSIMSKGEVVEPIVQAVILLLAVIASSFLTFLVVRMIEGAKRKGAVTEAEDILRRAEADVESRKREVEIELKEMGIAQKAEGEKEIRELRQAVHKRDRQLDKRQDGLEKQAEDLRKQEKTVESTQQRLAERLQESQRQQKELDRVLEIQRQTLHELSGLSQDEATERLLSLVDEELSQEIGARITRHEKRLAETCDEKSREVMLVSLQRYAAAHTAETTTSTVDIPNDDMKGRIIGREGRNIRAFEKATGVDVIIDDTPGVVIVSSFDMVRRETARIALNRLIADGRIHPSRIEEIVLETEKELEKMILKTGREAAQEVEAHGIHDRIIDLLGRLQFRTSYSQNVLRHSIEVAFVAGMLADEIGLDAKLARRCGLLHDIGKAVDHEQDGTHPELGGEVARICGECEDVILSITDHHATTKPSNIYTVLVQAADAISAARPGARRESMEMYVKRLEQLESLAKEQNGVQESHAIQAGREVRVIVDAKSISDGEAFAMSKRIAARIEEEMTFPGEIKVTVLREIRAEATAR